MTDVYRTPDERFERLPGYGFEPRYVEQDGLRMPGSDRARDEQAEQHRDEGQHGRGDQNSRRVANHRRARSEYEPQELGEARGHEGGRDAGEGEDDEELNHLDRGEILDRLAAHGPGAASAAATSGELLDHLRPADRV